MARDPHAAPAVPQPEPMRANGWQPHALGSDARTEEALVEVGIGRCFGEYRLRAVREEVVRVALA
jgi:hypothetical protein